MKAFYYKLKKYKNSKLFEKTRWKGDAILILDKLKPITYVERGKFICLEKRLH